MVDLKSDNLKFRYADQPPTDAEYEYRIVHDAGLTARNPDLATRYPNVSLGGPVSFVERRPVRPRKDKVSVFASLLVGVGISTAAWGLWRDGELLLAACAAVLGVLLAVTSALFTSNSWEISLGTPLALAAEHALPEDESSDPMARTQRVPLECWAELDLATAKGGPDEE